MEEINFFLFSFWRIKRHSFHLLINQETSNKEGCCSYSLDLDVHPEFQLPYPSSLPYCRLATKSACHRYHNSNTKNMFSLLIWRQLILQIHTILCLHLESTPCNSIPHTLYRPVNLLVRIDWTKVEIGREGEGVRKKEGKQYLSSHFWRPTNLFLPPLQLNSCFQYTQKFGRKGAKRKGEGILSFSPDKVIYT